MEDRTIAALSSLTLFYTILSCNGLLNGRNIYITLRNKSNATMSYKPYRTDVFCDTKNSSVDPKGIKGYLHQPKFVNGCFVQNVTGSWFAVLEDYPERCTTSTLLSNIRYAGYDLVLMVDSSLSKPNSNFSCTESELQLPIVAVSKTYKDYLTGHAALSEISDPGIEAAVKFDVKHFYFIIITILAGLCVIVLIWLICCTLCCYCRNRRLRRNWAVANIQQRQRLRNFEQLTDRDRIARRELVNSILRQLQQLQLEGEIQRPLGTEQTRELPTQKYKSTSTPESCVICVEDFENEDMVRVLPCGHYFHINCIDEWLINHSDVCPLCKNRVSHEQLEDNQRYPGRTNTVLSSFDETEETDTDPLVSTERPSGQGRLYGSV